MVTNFVEVTRTEEFSAAHRLHNKSLTAEANRSIYGKCNHHASHGHNYKIKVTIRGAPDQLTGMVYNMSDLKKEVQSVLDHIDHKNLDYDVEYFKSHVSTTENLAIYLWEELKKVMSSPELLWKVYIKETSKNSFAFFGPQED